MKTVAILILFMFNAIAVDAGEVGADRILSFAPGVGQNSGQGPLFFPKNVLGFPDPAAADSAPSTDPRQVCSIGLGGVIILGFSEHAIVDAPGADFVVYENAFTYGANRVYAEPGTVSVSKDGVTWVDFQYDERTLQGCAGVSPTDRSLDHGGGNAFDLATIGVDSIRWIRITDITQRILDDPSHPFYDPTLSGFDLDAVVGLHSVRVADVPSASFDPLTEQFTIGIPIDQVATISLYDVSGTLLYQQNFGAGIFVVDGSNIPAGLIIGLVRTPLSITTIKILR